MKGVTKTMYQEYYNKEKKRIGYVKDSVYITERTPMHFFRVFQGFGISLSVIDDLIKNNIEKIEIIYLSPNGTKRYRTSPLKFKESTLSFTFDVDDIQKIVKVKEMEES